MTAATIITGTQLKPPVPSASPDAVVVGALVVGALVVGVLAGLLEGFPGCEPSGSEDSGGAGGSVGSAAMALLISATDSEPLPPFSYISRR